MLWFGEEEKVFKDKKGVGGDYIPCRCNTTFLNLAVSQGRSYVSIAVALPDYAGERHYVSCNVQQELRGMQQ